jgi:hypothetical protein
LTEFTVKKVEFESEAATAQDALEDIDFYRQNYDGFQNIHTFCYARPDGDYLHPTRIVTITAAFDEFGHKQQLHTEWGYLWVNAASEESDGGTP